MSQDFSGYVSSLTAPASDAAAITPSDASDLPYPARSIYVGGTGTLRVRMISGEVVDFTDVQGGAVYPIRVAQVMASGTSATGLVALA
ncbi:hypothetical protein AB838_06920 [Rhodobacteraceae bacterium (ex Bugula neritina AB1)]|nr:hypothetical protein AB838_06920 [Rhodobacteraceae bacterium (ex Bugula neritina AB1)]